jgi:hypothetical protein
MEVLMHIHGSLLPAAAIALLFQEGSVRPAAVVPESCPITLATDSTFIPPHPYSPLAPFANRFWYGTDELWAMPSSEGIWTGSVSLEGVFDKVFWWSTEWDWRHDHWPALTVTAQVLDGRSPPVVASDATNAHNEEDIRHAMLVGVRLPSRGCWEITGEYKGQRLSYTVWLP